MVSPPSAPLPTLDDDSCRYRHVPCAIVPQAETLGKKHIPRSPSTSSQSSARSWVPTKINCLPASAHGHAGLYPPIAPVYYGLHHSPLRFSTRKLYVGRRSWFSPLTCSLPETIVCIARPARYLLPTSHGWGKAMASGFLPSTTMVPV